MNRRSNWARLGLSVVLVGCASTNPNPGERTADKFWATGEFAKAIEIAEPQAELGEPWAQLRMAIFYDSGDGVEKNPTEAAKWYKKAAVQMAEGTWAEGKIIGDKGEAGYFGQRNDALIAQYRLAVLYSSGTGVELDLVKAYLLANNVVKKSNGESVFFCCAFSTVPKAKSDGPRGSEATGPHHRSGRWFTAEKIAAALAAIENAMTEQQLAQARELAEHWSPETGL
jgi:TPR repeat protein